MILKNRVQFTKSSEQLSVNDQLFARLCNFFSVFNRTALAKNILFLKWKYILNTVYCLLLTAYCSLLTGCKVYSFTGTTLSPDLKTITIQNFVMSTAGGPANMPLTVTEKLKEYYQRNTSLKIKPAEGDLFLEGSIVGYENSPVAVTSGDKAALNRLTITINVRFIHTKDESQNFEKDFSFYQDFSQEKTLSQVESSLVPKILDQIVLNIFNDTAAQW